MLKHMRIYWTPSLLVLCGMLMLGGSWLTTSQPKSNQVSPAEICYVSTAESPWITVVALAEQQDGDQAALDNEIQKEIRVHMGRFGQGAFIGVRLSPVPASLAAHVGEGGLLVTNVVADSPADLAGLQRYDIILEFDGEPVVTPGDLAQQVREAEGRTVELLVKRGQGVLSFQLQPTKRDNAADVAWKYDLENPLIEDVRKMRGMRVERGDDGTWHMLDLGDLDDEDQVIRRFNIDFDTRFPGRDFFFFDGSEVDPLDESTEVMIERVCNGQTVKIERDSDGQITVSRSSDDGEETVSSYGDDATLQQQDPEAYELLQESTGQGGFRFEFQFPEDWENLGKLRRDFQIDLKRQIDEAHRMGEAARVRAEIFAQEARQHAAAIAQSAQDAFTARVETRVMRTDDGEELAVTEQEDGTLRVVHRPVPGEEHSYRFDSLEAFAERLPELYERYESMPQD
jgi:hypothetical protein